MRKVRKSGKLVYGVGINDATYTIVPKGEKCCPFYQRWRGVLERCYSEKLKKKHPTYVDCAICEEWLLFSNFKAWMQEQDWEGKQLDKDLLVKGNKMYSPETCLFIPQSINKFMTDRVLRRGLYPLGVTIEGGFFKARCSNLGQGETYLGLFNTPEAAHIAYLKHKEKLSLELAEMQSDIRVKTALIERYKL